VAHLAPEYRGKVAENLQLPDESIQRLRTFDRAQAQVMESLALYQRPSQVVQLLRQYDLPMLILIALQSLRPIRSQIWRYLTCWANVQPPLNGNDLKKLGYKPGPQYRQILEQLLAAKLDGLISDRASAEKFLAENYPQ
jgi:tRNA nucleotidyltransferase (CCA-adding enzyme)